MKQYLDPIQPDGLSPGYDGLDSLPRFQAETTPPERNSNKGPEALLVRLRSSLLDARLASDIVKIVQLERMIGLLCRRHGLS